MEGVFWRVLLLEPEAGSMGPIGHSETPPVTLHPTLSSATQNNPEIPSWD